MWTVVVCTGVAEIDSADVTGADGEDVADDVPGPGWSRSSAGSIAGI